MKPLVIYYSQTGSTVRVAEAMAAALEADLATADAVSDSQLAGRPLIGLGSGIYYMKHPAIVYALADRLPARSRVFIFTTSGVKLKPFVRFYQSRLRRRLVRAGVEVLGEWHCPGYDQQALLKPLGINRGRPDRADCEAAATFARGLR